VPKAALKTATVCLVNTALVISTAMGKEIVP